MVASVHDHLSTAMKQTLLDIAHGPYAHSRQWQISRQLEVLAAALCNNNSLSVNNSTCTLLCFNGYFFPAELFRVRYKRHKDITTEVQYQYVFHLAYRILGTVIIMASTSFLG